MSDPIDRQAAIRLITGYNGVMDKSVAKRLLIQMPSAQPEQKWIPCDETVEIPDHEVLACDKYGEEILGYLEYADDQWICESKDCVMYDPIAWMEKPEPYVERRQDESEKL